MKKKVLITGANGFCGHYLSEYLRNCGTYQIYGTHLHKTKPPRGLISVPLNITHEKEVSAVIRKIKPDFLCHLAAQSNARLSAQMIDQTYRINLLGTIYLADAIRRFAPKCRMFYTSSVHVYGRTLRAGRNVTEKDSLWPESYYGFSKALSEFACLDLHQKFGLDVVIARSVNFFGEGQSEEFVFSDWCRQIALIELGRQKNSIKVGNLKLKRDFMFVRDGVELYELLMRKAKAGTIYNASSGKSRPLRTYLDFLISRAKVPIKVEVEKSRFRSDDPASVQISNQKIRKLGWEQKYSLTASLQCLLDYWRRRVRTKYE